MGENKGYNIRTVKERANAFHESIYSTTAAGTVWLGRNPAIGGSPFPGGLVKPEVKRESSFKGRQKEDENIAICIYKANGFRIGM